MVVAVHAAVVLRLLLGEVDLVALRTTSHQIIWDLSDLIRIFCYGVRIQLNGFITTK